MSNIKVLFLIAWLSSCVTLVFSQDERPLQGAATSSPRSQQSSSETSRQLTLGQAIEEKLKPGAIRLYRVALKAGEYMRVAINPVTNGVTVQAFDPNGKKVAAHTVGGATLGEALWVSANSAGDYEIRMTAPGSKADYGPYKIVLEKVAPLEAASVSDRLYLKAHAALFEGEQLNERGDSQSLQDAVAKFQQAVEVWRDLRERGQEAHTLFVLGYAYGRLPVWDKAVDSYAQADIIWKRLTGYESDEAITLYALGSTYAAQGKTAQAIDFYHRAAELSRTIHDRSGLASVLSNLGQAYINLGEFEDALKALQEGLQLRIQIEDVEGQARSLNNVAAVYYRLGEFQEALDYSLRSAPLRRASGDRRGEAITLSNIGTSYRQMGEPEKALIYQQQALDIIRELHDVDHNGGIVAAIGRSYFELGDYAKALDYLKQSLTLGDSAGPSARAVTLTDIGRVYASKGDRKEAIAYFEQSLKIIEEIGNPSTALTLESLGEVYRQARELEKAKEYFQQALNLSRTIKNRFSEANLLYDLARVDRDEGQLNDARRDVEDAIAIVESTRAGFRDAELRTSLLASKQDFYELEIDLLMSSYKQNRNQQTLVRAFNFNEQRRARTLLDSLETTRNIHSTVPAELLVRERDLRAKLNQKVDNQIKLLSGKFTDEQAAVIAKEIEKINTDYEQALAEIATADPHYAALTQSKSLDLSRIQKEILDPDAILLEYFLGKDRSYLWAVTSNDIAAYELPSRSIIEAQAHDVYRLLTSRSQLVKFEKPSEQQARIAKSDGEYYEASASLSQLILGPLAGKLLAKRLLIVSDGALEYVPFAALPVLASGFTKNAERNRTFRPLVVDHEITNLPSASILGALRQDLKNRKPPTKTLAVFADPVFSRTDERLRAMGTSRGDSDHVLSAARPKTTETSESEIVRAVLEVDGEDGLQIGRLPSTREEARAILALVPQGNRFAALDFDANRSTATSPELGHYRIVHFATHGLLNTTHPGLSGLILSLVDRRGNDQNGFVSTNEIFNLNLPADLVVLSGCRTGIGKEIKGEGVLGLTRGFMYAGAARVAVSLWDVNDDSTAELMARFYRSMLGKRKLSPAAALREAQIAMLQSGRWQHPYYWAAFVLQGEYR